MDRWSVNLLGIPSAARGPLAAHLRTRKTWAVLASLLLDPEGKQRKDTLARRFWPESVDPRKDLRQAIASLRSAFGAGTLRSDRDTVTIDRTLFDVDVLTLRRCCPQLPSNTSEPIAVEDLYGLAVQMSGEFLDGVDLVVDGDGWVEVRRAEFRRMAADLWLDLADRHHSSGNSRAAFECANRATSLAPEHPPTWTATMRFVLTASAEKRAGLPASDWRTLSAHLRKIERESLVWTPDEETQFRYALSREVERLPRTDREQLIGLSVFEGAFEAGDAEALFGCPRQRLARFVERAFLYGDDKLLILPAISRQLLREMMTVEERTRLARAHAEHFRRRAAEWITTDKQPPSGEYAVPDLHKAFRTIQKEAPVTRATCLFAGSLARLYPSSVGEDALAWGAQALRKNPPSAHDLLEMAHMLGMVAFTTD